ncbi:N-acetylmuramic acid 6-phosphate etherase [Acetobacter farinalis]|uniref:N-acetylmuramic acid 6-phosphate etherase n=1 Tax=Acetobacter farinalis TaxID=1260984 RepID=A0ABT3Q897_9PROT|nr:N-acetylmuramic acid 6-phosphate etherase [Acetobacter farinalis]MCX2561507.1 N-acetylmuramic acid 6-phosphate etherase [Acetobacter farinalis]NHO30426.1 N-acetylmuramic acid 6-phosphate etherase [Acetobacter farinalis]
MSRQASSALSAPARTETYDPRYEALDLWPTGTLLDALLESQLGAVASVKAALPGMEDAIAAALPRLQRGGRLFYVGAGTSGRIGLQDGVELIPTYGWPEERLVLLLAGGDAALFQPVEGAEDDEDAARAAMTTHKAGPDDVVIGVAASGGTPYTCAALACARAAGSLTIGLSCSPDTRLLRDAELGLLIETGPEVVAGSTRMKAGTAQKVALNMLSTALMIRLGHTWRGQMVDMRIVNAKLVLRAHRMVQQLTGCTEDEARSALEKANGSIKLAVLVCFGFSPEEGSTLLRQHAGNLRAALKDR